MLLHYLNFQLVSERVHLLWFYYLSVILDPCVVVAVMENTMLNCSLSVCENDSMHMSEGCFTNDFVELLKAKKHARIFVASFVFCVSCLLLSLFCESRHSNVFFKNILIVKMKVQICV